MKLKHLFFMTLLVILFSETTFAGRGTCQILHPDEGGYPNGRVGYGVNGKIEFVDYLTPNSWEVPPESKFADRLNYQLKKLVAATGCNRKPVMCTVIRLPIYCNFRSEYEAGEFLCGKASVIKFGEILSGGLHEVRVSTGASGRGLRVSGQSWGYDGYVNPSFKRLVKESVDPQTGQTNYTTDEESLRYMGVFWRGPGSAEEELRKDIDQLRVFKICF